MTAIERLQEMCAESTRVSQLTPHDHQLRHMLERSLETLAILYPEEPADDLLRKLAARTSTELVLSAIEANGEALRLYEPSLGLRGPG